MASIITDVGSFITGLMGWIEDILGLVTGNPILMVFVIIAIAGIVVGMAKRWIPGRS